MNLVSENGYNYFLNLAIAFDQFINAVLGGACDETFSSRCYRKSANSQFWEGCRVVVDTLLFFDKQHCYTSYIAEVERKQMGTS